MRGMTYDEFRRQLGKAGVTVKEFAGLVQLRPNSVTNYAKAGFVPSHLAVIAVLMGEMAEHKLDFKSRLEAISLSAAGRPDTSHDGHPIGR
jgi:hypothetical protein